MKKILIALFTFLLSFNMCFATYKPIPAHLSKQYKTEIEQIIDKEVPKAKKDANEEVLIAKKYRDKIIKYNLPINSSEYSNLILTGEYAESTALLPVYAELVRVTGKYVKIDTDVLATDYWGTPANYIDPYLKNNNVDTSQLDKLIDYVIEKREIIDRYVKEVQN